MLSVWTQSRIVYTFRPRTALHTQETLLLAPTEFIAPSEKRCGGADANRVPNSFTRARTKVCNLDFDKLPRNLPLSSAFTGLAADSKCIFGISKRPASLAATPLQINAFFDGRSYLILSAPQDRLYWFLFTNMKRATGSDIPRFTKDDETILAKKRSSDQLTESTTFGDIYKNRLHTALVPLEEHVFERWHFKRIITIGDAAHKVRTQPPEPTRPSSPA